MGLIDFGRYRVGFWMADETSPVELPEGFQAPLNSEPSQASAPLVVVAIDETGQPAWRQLFYGARKSGCFLLPWRGMLGVFLSRRASFLAEDGQIIGQHEVADDEWTGAWPQEDGLLLLGRKTAHYLEPTRALRWAQTFAGDGLHYLSTEGEHLRLAEMRGDDWREVTLDVRTGVEVLE